MIRIDNLAYYHPKEDVPIIDGLCLELVAGSCVGLTGRSGIGKTTIAKLIAGHLKPAKGMVTVKGRWHHQPSRKIFLMNQADDLFPWQDVRTQIAFALDQPDPQRVDELIDLVQLNGAEHRFPKELSGGMKKRLSLARALAVAPELLILDEAFGSVDIELKAHLYKVLKECQARTEITTLIITHDQADILNLADREIRLASSKPTRIVDDLRL